MVLNNTQLELLKKYFESKPVLKAYLFGSYARGEADAKSDVDILVDLDYSQHIGLQFIQMKNDVSMLLHKEVDLVSSSGLSKYFLPHIEKEKKLIYAR